MFNSAVIGDHTTFAAFGVDPNACVVTNILCDLCADADVVDVRDCFGGPTASYRTKARKDLKADVQHRMEAMMCVHYTSTALHE